MRVSQLKQFETLSKNIRHCLVSEDTEPDLELLAEKFKNYVEILAEADRTRCEEVYDYFCENNGLDLLRKLLRYDRLLVVKTLSLMLINLKNELWVGFILAQPLITQLIGLTVDDQDDELTEHYISFLKSLSIRLDANQVSLFYNKKFCRFPLVYQALKFYNHADNMVRTSVMNLTLGIMKIKNERVTRYFESFPFTMYVLHFCCGLNDQWKVLDRLIATLDPNTMKHRLKMEISDQQDSLYYLYDMFQYGGPRLKQNLKRCLMAYCLMPLLCRSLLLPSKEAAKEELLSPKLALYLLLLFLRIFKDRETVTLIAAVLFGRRLHKSLLNAIQRQMYIPQSYKAHFDNYYYWDKFEFEVDEHCESMFSDVARFETDHEEKKRQGGVSETAAEFNEEIGRISGFVGFGLLEHSLMEQKEKEVCGWNKYILEGDPEDMETNPVRQALLSYFEQSDESMLWILSSLLLFVQKNQEIDNEVLKFCGILMPRLDTVNFLDEYNVSSIGQLRNLALRHLEANAISNNYRLATLRNMAILVDELTHKELEPVEYRQLLHVYDAAIAELKNVIRPENINWVVKLFEQEHRRWMLHTYVLDPVVPYVVFINEKPCNFEQEPSIGRLLLKDPEFEEQVLQHLPSCRRQQVSRSIVLFTMCRSLVLRYLEGLHRMPVETERYAFDENYACTFNQTLLKWKVGKVYQFENRHMIECKQQPLDRKLKPTTALLIVQDKHNLVLVEPSKENSEGTVVLNVRYKGIEPEIVKDDPRLLLVRWCTDLTHGQYLLLFLNEIQCLAACDRLRQGCRGSFEEEQSFILKYVQNCLKELRALQTE